MMTAASWSATSLNISFEPVVPVRFKIFAPAARLAETSKQVALPPRDTVPVRHATQAVGVPPVLLVLTPHGVHSADPGLAANVPGGHDAHADALVWPGRELKLPAGHALQSACDARKGNAPYVPGTHGVCTPSAQNDPADTAPAQS